MDLMTMNAIYERAGEARDFIRARTSLAPKTALILGSGLGAFADQLESATAIAYGDIPHFPRSTVEGHSGRLLIGFIGDVPVAVMQGRVHGYEGYSPRRDNFPGARARPARD